MSDFLYGISLLAVAGIILITVLLLFWGALKEYRKPLYMRQYKKVTLPKGFLSDIQHAYEATQSFPGMLDILKGRYLKGPVRIRILAAEDYLRNSRYKDFETTLYQYLSDGTAECESVYRELISKETGKRYRLTCKNEEENII